MLLTWSSRVPAQGRGRSAPHTCPRAGPEPLGWGRTAPISRSRGTHRRPLSPGSWQRLQRRRRCGARLRAGPLGSPGCREGRAPQIFHKELGLPKPGGCGQGDSPTSEGRGGVGRGAETPGPCPARALHPHLGRAPSRPRPAPRPACSPRGRRRGSAGPDRPPPAWPPPLPSSGPRGAGGFGFQPRSRSLLPPGRQHADPQGAGRELRAARASAPRALPPALPLQVLTPLPARPPSPRRPSSISSPDRPRRRLFVSPLPLGSPPWAPANP